MNTKRENYIANFKSIISVLFLSTVVITFSDLMLSIFHCDIAYEIDAITWFIYAISSLGFAALFSVLLLLIFFIPISFLIRNMTIALVIYIIAAIITQCIILVDIHVFSLYKFHFNSNILNLMFEGGGEIFVFDTTLVIRVLLFFMLLAIVPYLIIYRVAVKCKLSEKFCRWTLRGAIYSILLGLLVSSFGYVYSYKKEKIIVLKTLQVIPLFKTSIYEKVYKAWNFVSQDEVDKLMFGIVYGDLEYPKSTIVNSDTIPAYNIIYILIT